MTTYNFGKRICKLLVESYREIFIGYVLGATDDLVNCAISAELTYGRITGEFLEKKMKKLLITKPRNNTDINTVSF